MRVELLYYTPAYHKLVEYCARRCYDSFDKCGTESHKLVRGIMSKGHLSVAGHGNIVFGVTADPDWRFTMSLSDVLSDIHNSLVLMKERNNFIRWTSYKEGSKFDFVVSMNVLTFIQAVLPASRKYNDRLADLMRDEVDKVDTLRWFYDKDLTLEGFENPYLESNPDLLRPHILVSDYEALKAAGLTDEELDVHATVTAEIVSDRAMSLQDARHKDMLARSEISQRYVDFNNFQYRTPNGIDRDKEFYVQELDMFMTFDDMMAVINGFYRAIQSEQEEAGVNKLRAKEQARSVLPNATLSHYIDTRPLRQWKHFFALRDDVHAQNEKQDDAKALIRAFKSVGISI